MDPVTWAARDLAAKERQIELAKEHTRWLESAENAGQDPCLFCKRTAFDIRMDQIEDRPWLRGDQPTTLTTAQQQFEELKAAFVSDFIFLVSKIYII